MADSGISVISHGTITADGTEQDLLNSVVVAKFTGWISLANMAAGDTLIIRQYQYIESVKTLYKDESYNDAQSEPAIYITPKISASQIVVSIEQTAGVYRDYLYEFEAETSLSQADILSDATPFNGADIALMKADIELIKKVESGRWKIVNNQMIFYDDDDLTPLLTFNLTNKGGTPTETTVYERTPV